MAARQAQVVKCDEAMRTVTLVQSVPGSKQTQTRTYHFDKAGRGAGGGQGGAAARRGRLRHC